MNSDNVNVFINSNELDYNTAMQIYTMLKDEVAREIFDFATSGEKFDEQLKMVN